MSEMTRSQKVGIASIEVCRYARDKCEEMQLGLHEHIAIHMMIASMAEQIGITPEQLGELMDVARAKVRASDRRRSEGVRIGQLN